MKVLPLLGIYICFQDSQPKIFAHESLIPACVDFRSKLSSYII